MNREKQARNWRRKEFATTLPGGTAKQTDHGNHKPPHPTGLDLDHPICFYDSLDQWITRIRCGEVVLGLLA
jgi:hypothetical protein